LQGKATQQQEEEPMAETRKNKDAGGASRNEGEGNKTAARHYNEASQRFAKSGKVEEKAREAEAALDTEEGRELMDAELVGKRHSHGEDPEVTRKK
jgi:hypothetical protein